MKTIKERIIKRITIATIYIKVVPEGYKPKVSIIVGGDLIATFNHWPRILRTGSSVNSYLLMFGEEYNSLDFVHVDDVSIETNQEKIDSLGLPW